MRPSRSRALTLTTESIRVLSQDGLRRAHGASLVPTVPSVGAPTTDRSLGSYKNCYSWTCE